MKREEIEYKIIEAIQSVTEKDLDKLKIYLSKPNRFKKNKFIDPFTSSHEWDCRLDADLPDTLKCVKCGTVATLTGKKFFYGMVKYSVIGGFPECNSTLFTHLNKKEGKRIILRKDLRPLFGQSLPLERHSIHECVPCPNWQDEKLIDAVWIDVGHIENGKQSPIRLLKDEYVILSESESD